jgi:inner membrane protein
MSNPTNRQTATRFAIIAALVLAMSIPLALVNGVADERQGFFDQTLADISATWGGSQQIAGPFLIIPEAHKQQLDIEDGQVVSRAQRTYQIVLPTQLELDIQIDHEMRHRAIYEVPVYRAQLQAKGSFDAVNTILQSRSGTTLLLDQAFIAVGISHSQAISAASALKLADANATFSSGTGQNWLGNGIKARVIDFNPDKPIAFEFDLAVKGTQRLDFLPLAEANQARVQSDWPHPSFTGRYLPEQRQITATGFTAAWQVNELARALPANWSTDEYRADLTGSFAGMELFQPITDYRTVDRAIKYGLLFVSLTFLSFACFELTQAIRFHPIQYGVVGLGLVLFYLAVLSLSEHMEFRLAYLSATILLTALIASYVWAMTRRRVLAVCSGSTVVILYATLYVLLQLESFALLTGTALLFGGLIALMYVTRSLTERILLNEPDDPSFNQPPGLNA